MDHTGAASAASSVRYASELAPIGVGIAARRCIRALITAGVEVAWEPIVDGPDGRMLGSAADGAPAWMRALQRPRGHGETVVLHCVPGNWRSIGRELRPGRLIGHSVWELDEVPRAWVAAMSEIDEFWVPTEWNRGAFARAFDRPVHVIPHAIDQVEPRPPPVAVPPDHLVVSLVSAWDWRKRPDRGIEAFLTAFTSADPVTLVVKTTPHDVYWPGGPVDVEEMIANIVARFPSPARVVVSTDVWTDGELRGLARRSACHLSMSATEGWGLGPFDAACEGVPVVITGFGGQLEYLGTDYPGLVPYRVIATNHVDRGLFELGTTWAHPNLDDAVDLLRAVVDGSAPDMNRRARTLAVELRRRYSPEAVGERARAALGHTAS